MSNQKNEYKGTGNHDCAEESDPTSPATTATRFNVSIRVTPLFSQGNQVVCAVDAPTANQKGGMINLPRGGSYTLEFQLQAGSKPELQNLRFRSIPPNDPTSTDGTNAFWCKDDDCPSPGQMHTGYSNPRLASNGRTLKVDVDTPQPTDPESAVHYSLNFHPNSRFDPIIIHD